MVARKGVGVALGVELVRDQLLKAQRHTLVVMEAAGEAEVPEF